MRWDDSDSTLHSIFTFVMRVFFSLFGAPLSQLSDEMFLCKTWLDILTTMRRKKKNEWNVNLKSFTYEKKSLSFRSAFIESIHNISAEICVLCCAMHITLSVLWCFFSFYFPFFSLCFPFYEAKIRFHFKFLIVCLSAARKQLLIKYLFLMLYIIFTAHTHVNQTL